MIFIENRLSADCLRNALVQRGLNAEGKMTVLHDWLLRYELDAPKNPVPSCFSSAEDLATRQLRFSTDAYSPTPCVVENGVHPELH